MLKEEGSEEGSAKTAIRAVHDVFKDQITKAVLLINTGNAFNTKNTKAMLHNISVICLIISTYINNCQNTPAHLFIIGGREILSIEGTT